MTTDWFVDNAARAFPFIAGAIGNPDAAGLQAAFPLYAIVDAQILFGPTVAFDSEQHKVWLASVSRDGDDLELTWRYSPTSELLLLTREIVMAVTATNSYQVVEASFGVPTSGGLDCTDEIGWELQLVFGPLLDRLDDWIADGVTLTAIAEEVCFEPGCIQSLYRQHARSINLANVARTRATGDDDCEELDWPIEPQDIYVQQTCLNGSLRFQEGYNASIEVNPTANRLIFNARLGAGKGATCEETAITPDEAPPAGRTTLDGGIRCNEVLRSVNGYGGKAVPFQAGTGVNVLAVAHEHKLIVTVGVGSSSGCKSVTDEDNIDCDSAPSASAPTTTTAEGGEDECYNEFANFWIWNGAIWTEIGPTSGTQDCAPGCQEAPPATNGLHPGEVRRGRCVTPCSTPQLYEWSEGPVPTRAWYPLTYTCIAPCVGLPPVGDGTYHGEQRLGRCS